MTLRDFSDKAYAKVKSKLQASIMEGEYDPGDLQYLEEYFEFRDRHGSDSYFEHYKKLEVFGEAAGRLKKVFEDVQSHDTAKPSAIATTKEHMASFTSIVTAMTEMINPRPVGGGPCALTLPPALYLGRLGGIAEEIDDLAMRRFTTTDENGSPVCDWDEMERTMQRDAGDITPAEYLALARLFSQMSEEDMAKFFQRLATPDENNNKEYYKPPPPLNKWTFDEDKVACLQIALASVYAENGQSFTYDAYARLSALAALPYLGVSYLNGDLYYTRSISGEYGTDYPFISISIGADKSVVIEYMSRRITVDNSSQSVISILLPDSMSLLAPQPADLAIPDLLAMIDKAIRERTGGDDEAILIDILGLFPGLGDVLGAADIVSSIEDYRGGQQFADRVESDNKKIGDLAVVYNHFGFEAVVMPLPDGSFTVFLHPGPETAQKIVGFNSLLAGIPGLISDLEYQKSLSDDDDDEEINEKLKNLHQAESIMQRIGYPITEQTIRRNPQEVGNLRQALNDAGIR